MILGHREEVLLPIDIRHGSATCWRSGDRTRGSRLMRPHASVSGVVLTLGEGSEVEVWQAGAVTVVDVHVLRSGLLRRRRRPSWTRGRTPRVGEVWLTRLVRHVVVV